MTYPAQLTRSVGRQQVAWLCPAIGIRTLSPPHPPSAWWGLAMGMVLWLATSTPVWAVVVGSVSLNQNLTYTDNFYNAPQGQELSEWSASTGLGARLLVPWGRQMWNNNFSIKTLRHQDQTQNNSLTYSGSSGLNWQTIGNLSGSVAMTMGKNSYASGLDDIKQTSALNLVTTRGVSANAELGAGQVLSFSTGISQKTLDYSLPEFKNNNTRQMDFSLGTQWAPHPDTRFGLQGGIGHGEFPEATATSNTGFDSTSITLSSRLHLMDVHDLTASVGYSQQVYEGGGTRSNGWNGDLNWQIKLGSRLSGNISIQHGQRRNVNTWEISANPNNPDNPALSLDFIGDTINTTIGTNLSWSISSKIRLSVGASRTQRKNATDNPLLGNDGVPFEDQLHTLNASLGYQIMRSISLSCRVNANRRQVISAQADLSTTGFRTLSSDCGFTVGFP